MPVSGSAAVFMPKMPVTSVAGRKTTERIASTLMLRALSSDRRPAISSCMQAGAFLHGDDLLIEGVEALRQPVGGKGDGRR